MNPQLLHIYGPFWVTSYGLFMALGLGVFLSAAFFHDTRRDFICDDQFFDAAAVGIAGGLLGGKLLYMMQHAGPVFASRHAFIASLLGGFAILGAIVGAFVSVTAYLWWHQLAIRKILDIAGAYVLLAHGIAVGGVFLRGAVMAQFALFRCSVWCTVTLKVWHRCICRSIRHRL